MMKTCREAIAAMLSLVLGVSLMAALVHTDLYAQAAGAEARGDQALFQAMDVGPPAAARGQLAPAALEPVRLALNEVRS